MEEESFSIDFSNNQTIITPLFFDWKLKKRDEPKFFKEKYLRGQLIGRGEFTEVIELLDMSTLQRRAVKVYDMQRIRKDVTAHNYLEFIPIELEVTLRLNHKNVIRVFETSTADLKTCKYSYLIMEYCVISIEKVIKCSTEKKLTVAQCRKYFVELIDGIEYLHSKGVIHRDIKPENLLLTNENVLKISDFGVCEVIDKYDERNRSVHKHGSASYMAPEIFLSCEDETIFLDGFKLDIWGCGVTLYKMITGEMPFSDSLVGTYVTSDEFKVRDELENDPLLLDFFSKLLVKESENRINIDGIRRHPWFKQELVKHVIAIPTPTDDYMSISMTPSIHQLHYPLTPEENVVTVPDKQLPKFERLQNIPIIRSNRSRKKRKRLGNVNLTVRLYRAIHKFIFCTH